VTKIIILGFFFQAGETFRGFITVAPVDLTGKTLLISASLSDGNSIELGTITAKGAISANKPVIICTSGSSTSAVATLDGVEYASLQAAISASEDESKEITILKDIELSQPLQLFSENRVTINLNGKNVITTSNTGVLFDGGHLTIKGSGTFGDPTQKTTAYLFNMKAYSVMTVEGDATFYSALDCFYLENETTLGYVDLYIKGGKWIGGEQNGVYWTINKYDKAAGDINVSVTGGEFYKYNPAASHSENPVANFVADGYGVIKNGDWYKVVKATEVTDEASLKSAISSSKSVPVIVDNTMFILEVKTQNVAGSVDEKLQTCDFKKKQYQKLLSQLNMEVQYIYILDDWFGKPQYKDVLDYIISVGCQYYFNYIPLQKLGLPVPK